MALGLCRRELVDRSTELGRPTTKAPIYGLGLQAEFRRELISLFLSWSEQLIHSSSLAFPTTKDCTLKLSKDKPFLGLHCTQMFSPQQRKFLDNPLLSPTLLLSEFCFQVSFLLPTGPQVVFSICSPTSEQDAVSILMTLYPTVDLQTKGFQLSTLCFLVYF